ncbi:MAG: DUF4105 domain-containing protein [Campylobacterales bacterium]
MTGLRKPSNPPIFPRSWGLGSQFLKVVNNWGKVALLLIGIGGGATPLSHHLLKNGKLPPLPPFQREVFKQIPTSSSYWLDLLHMRPTLFGFESEVDDPSFFISKTGKWDPAGELKRELKLFQQPDRARYICRFPLRFLYLQKRFHLPPFPLSNCPKLAKVLKDVAPTRVSIIFADATINKPAYMFGHTLLRLDNPETPALIATAINYAAETGGQDGGLAFAFKGIFGFYPGYFTPMPYYDKIKQYLQNESRDLWEYPLNLTPGESKILLLHSWELKDIYTDYYFFTENCSYELLWLLQLAKPKWGVIDRFRGRSVIPIDTIRYLWRVHGITDRRYRPSLFTQIKVITAPLSNRELEWVRELGLGEKRPEEVPLSSLPVERQRRILDGAVRYLQFTAKREGWSKEKYLPLFLSLTKARSRVVGASHYRYPIPTPPEEGHNSHRLSIGGGRGGEDQFLEVGLRGAYHSFEDLGEGFKFGSQVIFFEPRLRYLSTSHRWHLQQIGIINLKSVIPTGILFRPISWKVKFGLYRIQLPDRSWRVVPTLNPGGGFGYPVAGGYLYGLLQTSFQFHPRFQKNWRIGVGGEVGYLHHFQWGELVTSADRLYSLPPNRGTFTTITGGVTFKIDRNNGVNLRLEWEKGVEINREGGIFLFHYFDW